MSSFCQISACCPATGDLVDAYYDVYVEPFVERLGEAEQEEALKVNEALGLLSTEDEEEGHRAISIIGAFHDHKDEPLWDTDFGPDSLEQLLNDADGHVRVLSGWSVGGDECFATNLQDNENEVLISSGCCFFVQNYMLPILEAATYGRVSPQRLWRLAMARGHFPAHHFHVLPGVDYGPIRNYLGCYLWYLGDVRHDGLHSMGRIGTPKEIAEVLRKRGFWMWMRPDRFPVDSPPASNSALDIPQTPPAELTPFDPISKLPFEILQLIALYSPLLGIVTLAMVNRSLYHQLLGNNGARNATARAYMRTQARWCLPYGEAEVKWWNDRNGDDVLGWSYLKRCLTESHSMRNRKRVWKAAQSIEQECELEEARRSRV